MTLDTVKAILLASCDRKCLERYTEGLTEKEGSGVVNAQRAINITSKKTYSRFPSSVNAHGIILRNSSDYCKCALVWEVPASNANNTEIPDFKLELGYQNSNNYIGTNSPNSSAEVLVTNAFEDDLGYNYVSYRFLRVDNITSNFMFTIAWYDLG